MSPATGDDMRTADAVGLPAEYVATDVWASLSPSETYAVLYAQHALATAETRRLVEDVRTAAQHIAREDQLKTVLLDTLLQLAAAAPPPQIAPIPNELPHNQPPQKQLQSKKAASTAPAASTPASSTPIAASSSSSASSSTAAVAAAVDTTETAPATLTSPSFPTTVPLAPSSTTTTTTITPTEPTS